MWGENAVEMLWDGLVSTVAQVPLANIWLLIAFGIYTVVAVFATHKLGAKRVAPFVIVLLAPILAMAVPHIFINGEIADADQVNENFADVDSRLEDRKFTISGIREIGTDTSIALPHSKLESMCKDLDGCSFRLCSSRHAVEPNCARSWRPGVQRAWYLQARTAN